MLITLDDAVQIVMSKVKLLPHEAIGLDDALGRVLARPVKADRDLPPADLSAMDGYAIRAEDLAPEQTRLKVIGESAAGRKPAFRVRRGEAARIYTGALLPSGADTVVMVEQCVEENGVVVIAGPVKPYSMLFRRAENASRKDVLIPAGEALRSPSIGTCAAVGASPVRVYRHPATAILCTGEELRAVEDAVKPHETRNSNGPMLQAALREWGFSCKRRVVADRLSDITRTLRRLAGENDVLIVTGGVSKGRYDFVREAVERIGGRIQFHGVSMKPGKPQLFATLKGGRLIFALPGNPLSAMTGLHELVLPAMRRMVGYEPERCRPVLQAILQRPLANHGDRLRMVLARVKFDGARLAAEPVGVQSSGDVVACAKANGAIILPCETELDAGALAEFHPWTPELF